jgi:hypothetical protein
LNAGIIEMEACFKAARIAIEQGCTLQASTFLQNVIFINLTLSETEKVSIKEILWYEVFSEYFYYSAKYSPLWSNVLSLSSQKQIIGVSIQ